MRQRLWKNNLGHIKSKRGWDGRITLLGVRLCNAHKDEKHLRELCFDLNIWIKTFVDGIDP